MATTTLDTRLSEVRTGFAKPLVPFVSWGALFGGVFAGMAAFFLLALLGMAAGFTALEPQAAEPVGNVPIFAGIWSGISMLAGGFVGAYIAARMSGMTRRTDGILHGFVAWGVSTLFFVYLATSGIGALLGGVFGVLGQGAQTAATSPTVQQQLEEIIPGTQERQGIGQQVEERQVAQTAVEGLTRASWFLFAAVLLSLIVSLVGGLLGAKAIEVRRHPLHGHAERSA